MFMQLNTKPPIIYEAVADGEMSCVRELTEADTDWHYASIDDFQFFRTRAAAVRELKRQLRDRVKGLQRAIKELK